MISAIFKVISIVGFAAAFSSARVLAEPPHDAEELWSCSGYCFMGGDTATNPWIPVGSSGFSEEEARENIDCGQFFEEGIACEMVAID